MLTTLSQHNTLLNPSPWHTHTHAQHALLVCRLPCPKCTVPLENFRANQNEIYKWLCRFQENNSLSYLLWSKHLNSHLNVISVGYDDQGTRLNTSCHGAAAAAAKALAEHFVCTADSLNTFQTSALINLKLEVNQVDQPEDFDTDSTWC